MTDADLENANQQNEQVFGTATPVKSNVSGIDNISPEPVVPSASLVGDTPASAIRHLYSDPGASTSSGNQSFYPVAALPELSLSKTSPFPDKKCSTDKSIANGTVVYDDLLVPYCKLCRQFGISENEKKSEYCQLCSAKVAYLCSQCHGVAETYDQGVAHLNNLHQLYQKMFCPICGHETYDMYSMSNHMIAHDRNRSNSPEEE